MREFFDDTGVTEYALLTHFRSWRDAVAQAGIDYVPHNQPHDPERLLDDWGEVVRRLERAPTRDSYRRNGTYSPAAFVRYFGAWSAVRDRFLEYARGKPQWSDVVSLVWAPTKRGRRSGSGGTGGQRASTPGSKTSSLSPSASSRVKGRTVYGNPIDFRGLRHEPVNENGVILLFGMVARELGFLVESVQVGYPDCEAKRLVAHNKWQKVRIEFEYESRNFRDHGHPVDGCDMIVCWRHNWSECPEELEVLELETVIRSLAADE